MGKQQISKSAGIDKALAKTSPQFRAMYSELDRRDPQCGKESLLNALATYLGKGQELRSAECSAVKAIIGKKPSIFSVKSVKNGERCTLRIAEKVFGTSDRTVIIARCETMNDSQLIKKLCDAILASG